MEFSSYQCVELENAEEKTSVAEPLFDFAESEKFNKRYIYYDYIFMTPVHVMRTLCFNLQQHTLQQLQSKQLGRTC